MAQENGKIIMAEPEKKKLKMVCSTCGSDQVLRDAWAEWDVASQDWVLQNVFDAAYCEKCEGETSINEEPINE